MSIFEWLCAATFVGVGLFFLLFLATLFARTNPLNSYLANSGVLALGIGFLLGAIGLFGSSMTVNSPSTPTYGAMSLVALFFGVKYSYLAIRNFREEYRFQRQWKLRRDEMEKLNDESRRQSGQGK